MKLPQSAWYLGLYMSWYGVEILTFVHPFKYMTFEALNLGSVSRQSIFISRLINIQGISEAPSAGRNIMVTEVKVPELKLILLHLFFVFFKQLTVLTYLKHTIDAW